LPTLTTTEQGKRDHIYQLKKQKNGHRRYAHETGPAAWGGRSVTPYAAKRGKKWGGSQILREERRREKKKQASKSATRSVVTSPPCEGRAEKKRNGGGRLREPEKKRRSYGNDVKK